MRKDQKPTWHHPMDWVIAVLYVATLIVFLCGYLEN